MLKLQLVEKPDYYVKLSVLPVSLGRNASNNLVLDNPNVSDFHAEINADERGLYIVDLLSTGGTFVNEHRVSGRCRLQSWDAIRLGSIHLEINDPNTCRPGSWVLRTESDLLVSQFHVLKEVTIVGRDSECDLTIDWHLLSRKHAAIYIEDDQLRVVDLDSRNGTFINGERITESIAKSDDEIRFDQQRFVVVGPYKPDTENIDDDRTEMRDSASPFSLSTPPKKQNSCHSARLLSPSIKNSENCFALEKNIISIGRSATNDLVINDPGVSKKHAILSASNTCWTISDNNSRNGIEVNGEAVKEANLKDGDRITIGLSELVFENTPAPDGDDTVPYQALQRSS